MIFAKFSQPRLQRIQGYFIKIALGKEVKASKTKKKVGGHSFKEIDQLCFEFSDMQYFFSIFLEYGLLQFSKKVCKNRNFLKLMISGYFLMASCMKQFLASLQRIR